MTDMTAEQALSDLQQMADGMNLGKTWHQERLAVIGQALTAPRVPEGFEHIGTIEIADHQTVAAFVGEDPLRMVVTEVARRSIQSLPEGTKVYAMLTAAPAPAKEVKGITVASTAPADALEEALGLDPVDDQWAERHAQCCADEADAPAPSQPVDIDDCCCGETDLSWTICPLHGESAPAPADVTLTNEGDMGQVSDSDEELARLRERANGVGAHALEAWAVKLRKEAEGTILARDTLNVIADLTMAEAARLRGGSDE